MSKHMLLHTEKKPTFLNSSMAIATGLVGLFTLNPAALAIGAAVGGLHGKRKMSQDYQHGKLVRTPHLLNKKAFAGALLAALASAVVVVTMGLSLTPAVVAADLGAIIVGTVTGATMGKREQQKEYAEAMYQHQQGLGIVRQQQHAVEPERVETMTPGKFVEKETARRYEQEVASPGLG